MSLPPGEAALPTEARELVSSWQIDGRDAKYSRELGNILPACYT